MDASAQPESFQGRGIFLELGHFNKYFVRNAGEKKTPQEKSYEFFHQNTSKDTHREKAL